MRKSTKLDRAKVVVRALWVKNGVPMLEIDNFADWPECRKADVRRMARKKMCELDLHYEKALEVLVGLLKDED